MVQATQPRLQCGDAQIIHDILIGIYDIVFANIWTLTSSSTIAGAASRSPDKFAAYTEHRGRGRSRQGQCGRRDAYDPVT